MIDIFRNAWKMGVEAEDYDASRWDVACTRCDTRTPTPGNETELGRINELLAAVSVLETLLPRQIKKFGYTSTAVIGVGVHSGAPTGN